MEIINGVQKETLLLFGKMPDSALFYLTGGTALAYFYLKHRRSDDLDFFTAEEELIDPFSRHLENALKAKAINVSRRRSHHSFVELLADKADEVTVIHIACDSAFRLENTTDSPEYPGLKLDSLSDIAANKLLALFGRAAFRDFVDVYFLVKKAKFNMEELSDKAKKKDPGFDLYWLGVAFERIHTYRDTSPEMLLLTEDVKFVDLLAFFDKWREVLARKLI